VLIGLRTCYKEDIRASTAELLYGKTLQIPGKFFDHEDMLNDTQPFVEPFRRLMQRMKPIPVAHHVRNRPFVFKNVYTCTHVFLRDDSTKCPLEQPYTDPHRVLERISELVFTVEVDGKRFNISVDRLKPAYATAQQEELPTNKPSTVQSPTEPSSSKKTRSIVKTYPSVMQSKTKRL